MRKVFIVLIILYVIQIICSHLPYQNNIDDETKLKIQQETCNRNNGTWNSAAKECYFNNY